MGMRAGLERDLARIIAWADIHVDEVTAAAVYGLQTQAYNVSLMTDPQIQATTLVPFHFLPGDGAAAPWVVTRDGRRARALVELAGNDPIGLGMALHTHQDSYSHEGFSGWREELNNRHLWYEPDAILPNVGHAEMGTVPDRIEEKWVDRRTGLRIDNRQRALAAARETFMWLRRFSGLAWDEVWWEKALAELRGALGHEARAERERALGALIEVDGGDYAGAVAGMEARYQGTFVRAAHLHLAAALELTADLPRD